jgi:hypothetical protein
MDKERIEKIKLEFYKLLGKANKLSKFIKSDDRLESLGTTEAGLMHRQLAYMYGYAHILELRLKNAGVNVRDEGE